jgi:hypothetical protein
MIGVTGLNEPNECITLFIVNKMKKETRREIDKLSGEIQILSDKLEQILLDEIERIARSRLRRNKKLKEFVMAMGSWFFTKWGNNYNGEDYDCRKIADIIGEFSKLKLTGNAMRFTADGEKRTDW